MGYMVKYTRQGGLQEFNRALPLGTPSAQSALGLIGKIVFPFEQHDQRKYYILSESASSPLIINKLCQECLAEPIANFSD